MTVDFLSGAHVSVDFLFGCALGPALHVGLSSHLFHRQSPQASPSSSGTTLSLVSIISTNRMKKMK